MGAVDVCAERLRSGLNPCEIATQEGISLSTVFSYLDRAVGEDKIARSEIYFSMPRMLRNQVEMACRESNFRYPRGTPGPVSVGVLASTLGNQDAEAVQVCLRYGPASRYYGDLYELVRRYEIDLHRLVRDALVGQYGTDERAWWYKGVPQKVRIDCAARAETVGRWDLDPWNCSMLLDLQTVIDQQWSIFSKLFKAPSKGEVSAEVRKVNDTRNRVMHPVRDSPPTEEDFDTISDAYRKLQQVRERLYGPEKARETQSQ